MPAAQPKPSPAKTRASPRPRKTVAAHEIIRQKAVDPVDDDEAVEDDEEAVVMKKNHLRRTSTGSRFTEDLDLEKRPASRPGSRPGSRHSTYNRAAGITKRTTYSVKSAKSSMDIKRQPIAEDEGIVVAQELSNSNGRSLAQVSSKDEDATFNEEDYKLDIKDDAKMLSVELFDKITVKIKDELEPSTGKRKLKLDLVR